MVSLDYGIGPPEIAWEDFFIEVGFFVDDSIPVGGMKGTATSSANIPFIIEVNSCLFKIDLGESTAIFGIAGILEEGAGVGEKFKVGYTVWLLKVEVSKWHAP